MNNLFVYGSLKQDGPNHFLLRGEQNIFFGQARTVNPDFSLLSLGKFPAMVEGDHFVSGELYQIDQSTEQRIDRLEQGLYVKILLPVEITGADGRVFLAHTYLWDHTIPINPVEDPSRIFVDEETNTVHWQNDTDQFN